jgi:hypothetical protein
VGYEVVLTEPARDDLREIVAFIAQDNPHAAVTFRANTRAAYYRAIDQFLDWVERATTLIRSNGLISTTPNSIDLPAGIATPPIGVLNANFVLIFHFGLLGCFLQHLPIGIDLIRCCGILTKFAMRQYRAFLVTYKIA